jgi:hypothetical protein
MSDTEYMRSMNHGLGLEEPFFILTYWGSLLPEWSSSYSNGKERSSVMSQAHSPLLHNASQSS